MGGKSIMFWDEAIEEAKEELGYDENEYIEDWNEVVETAKKILCYEQKKGKLFKEKKQKKLFELKKRYYSNKKYINSYTCQKCGFEISMKNIIKIILQQFPFCVTCETQIKLTEEEIETLENEVEETLLLEGELK